MLLVGFFTIDAKVWGVVLMGLATLIFFLLPWLDRSPVKSIRYKGGLYKGALAVFVIAFLVLGYYGTQPVTDLGTAPLAVLHAALLRFFPADAVVFENGCDEAATRAAHALKACG